jgi:AraC-like DNA-binding protein
MPLSYKILLLLLPCLLGLPTFAQTEADFPSYDHWDKLSSEQLMQKGEYYRNEALMPDSALVCFSIVANRYYQGHQNREDIDRAIEAMTHIAWLYMQDFYDYTKAVSYNLRAQELAEKYHSYGYMPFIINNNANIRELTGFYENSEDFDMEVVTMQKQAFSMALEQEQWHALYTSFINLAMRTTFEGREELIEDEMDTIRNLYPPDMTTHFKYARCLAEGIQTMHEQQLDNAAICFNRLLDIAQEHDNPRQQALGSIIANDFLFLCYGEMEEHEKALAAVKANEALALNSNLQLHLLDAYKNLAGFYQFMNDEKMSEHYQTRYLESEVEMLTRQRLSSANEAQFLFQLNKKNEEVREMAYREKMKSRMLVGAIVIAVLLLVLLALLFINYRKVQEQNRQLYAKSLEMIRADEEKRGLIERLQAEAKDEAEDGTKSKTHTMDEGKMSDLMQRVFIVMETSDEIFSPDFSLPRLSELAGDKRNNVSEAINQRYKNNFNGLLNEYRIKEACRRFNDPDQYGHLTVEAIGQSVGFKSRSAFSTVFKQIVGLTPSAYLHQVRSNLPLRT